MTCDCKIKTEAEIGDALYKCNKCKKLGYITGERHKMLVKYKILSDAIEEIATFPQTEGDNTMEIVAAMRQIAMEARDDLGTLEDK